MSVATRAIDVLRDEGILTLADRAIQRYVYCSQMLYVMRYELSEADTDACVLKVDPGLCRNFILSRHAYLPCPSYHMPSILDFKKRLDYGCVATAIFYKDRLATIGWSMHTLESCKADKGWYETGKRYVNWDSECVSGGQWTDPVLRGLGFGTQGLLLRTKYNLSLGKKVTWGTCHIDNKPALAMQLKAGAKVVGKARSTRTPFGIRWEEL